MDNINSNYILNPACQQRQACSPIGSRGIGQKEQPRLDWLRKVITTPWGCILPTIAEPQSAQQRLDQLWSALTQRGNLAYGAGTILTFIILVSQHLRWQAWRLMKSFHLDLAKNLVDIVTVDDEKLKAEVLASFLEQRPSAGRIMEFMERAPQFAQQAFQAGAEHSVYEMDDLAWIAANIPSMASAALGYAKRTFRQTIPTELVEKSRTVPLVKLTATQIETLWARAKEMGELDEIDRLDYSKEQEFHDLWSLFHNCPEGRAEIARLLLRRFPPDQSRSPHGTWYCRLSEQSAEYFVILTRALMEEHQSSKPVYALALEINRLSRSLAA